MQPTLKELFSRETLVSYVEAARVKTLDQYATPRICKHLCVTTTGQKHCLNPLIENKETEKKCAEDFGCGVNVSQ